MPCTRNIEPVWPDSKAVSQYLTVGDLRPYMLGKEICQNVAWAYDTLTNALGPGSVRISSVRRGVMDTVTGQEGNQGSMHIYGLAIDLAFNKPGVADKLYRNDQVWAQVMDGLAKIGAGGLGLYDTHVHVDFRTTSRMFYDERTKRSYNMVFWDKRTSLTSSAFLLPDWPWYYYLGAAVIIFLLLKR